MSILSKKKKGRRTKKFNILMFRQILLNDSCVSDHIFSQFSFLSSFSVEWLWFVLWLELNVLKLLISYRI